MRLGKLGAPMIALALLLSGCGSEGAGQNRAEELALAIRGEHLTMTAATAKLDVTADYGQRVYAYTLDLTWGREQGFGFTVIAPEDIAGVAIKVAAGETALEYEGARIETGAITPSGASPIDALPAFFDYAQKGFIATCALEGEVGSQALRVDYREPTGTPGQGTEATLWFAVDTHALQRGELLVDGATVIQCVFTQFTPT